MIILIYFFPHSAIALNQRHLTTPHQTLKLNREDSEAFVAALLEPFQPNEALRVAASNYMRSGDGSEAS